MNHRDLMAAMIAVSAFVAPASAGEWKVMTGNDTGGIISWSPAIAARYRHAAAEHCAAFDKIAVITSVHRRYGDYVGFRCYFPRGFDPRNGVATSHAIRALY